MRLLLGGGGSGGHVFPALAVASTLQTCIREELAVLYAGTEFGIEATLVQDAGLPYATVAARGVRGRNALSKAWSALAIGRGIWDGWRLVRRFQPDAVLLTGGYVSVPVGVAARLARRPLVVFQPDVEPGWAVRLLARLATKVCVSDAASLAGLPPGKGVHTGYPLRPVFRDLDRPMARARFQLNGEPAILVAGAVQGARRINAALYADLEAWLALAHVIHVTGPNDFAEARDLRDALPAELQRRYQVFDYLGDDLPVAMAACDLAVSRAGASVLGEYPAAGTPAVLIPLPEGGGLQRQNAEAMVAAGAAVVVADDEVANTLLPTVKALLQDAPRLQAMREHAAARARLDAAERIAKVIWEVRK